MADEPEKDTHRQYLDQLEATTAGLQANLRAVVAEQAARTVRLVIENAARSGRPAPSRSTGAAMTSWAANLPTTA